MDYEKPRLRSKPDEPLPCPFCGATGLARTIAGADYDGELDAGGMLGMRQPGIGYWCVCCIACEGHGPIVKASKAQAVKRAIAAWNKRAQVQGRLEL